MHDYRRLVQETMDAKGLRPAEVARLTGLSRQTLSKLLNDDREVLTQRPDLQTAEALAEGLGLRVEVVLAAIASSMGLPVKVSVAGLQEATDDQLLAEVRRRMRAAHDEHDDEHDHPDDRERGTAQREAGAAPAGRGGAGGRDPGVGQKTVPGLPEDFDLAAHPPMELMRDRQDAAWGGVGEANQDNQEEGA